MRASWLAIGSCALFFACSSSSGSDASNSVGAGGAGGSGGAASSSGLNGCAEADFKDVTAGTDDDRMVMTASGKEAFTQRCLTIKASQSVMFMMDFAAHPLMPGIAPSRPADTGATEPNPIQETHSGDQTSFAFPLPGSYPYYCMNHEALGMYGVVRVIPDAAAGAGAGGASGSSGAAGANAGGSGGSSAGGSSAGGSAGASAGGAGAGGAGGGAMSLSLNGCAQADYQDTSSGPASDRMIMVTSGKDLFEMPCMEIAAGQSVMFMWSYTAHPLMPGVAPSHAGETGATTPSPIPMKSSGPMASVTFPAAGYYPYYCADHEASGMVGVVKVKLRDATGATRSLGTPRLGSRARSPRGRVAGTASRVGGNAGASKIGTPPGPAGGVIERQRQHAPFVVGAPAALGAPTPYPAPLTAASSWLGDATRSS